LPIKEINPFEVLGEKLRTTARRPNINSYEPHEKQLAFHKALNTITQYIGGNRSGKTTGGVVEDIWYAKGEHPYKRIPEAPNAIRVCTVDFNYGFEKIIKPEMARWIPPSLLINGSWEDSFKKEPPVLNFSNGSFIEFMSYEQKVESFAGTSRDLIHHDEEPPQNIYKENLMRIIDCHGRMTITMTPVEGMTWTYENIYIKGQPEDGSAGDSSILIIEADMFDNPYIGEVEAQLILQGLTKEELAARKSGRYVQFGGLIYGSFNENYHTVSDFKVPDNWSVYASMDHGLRNPTSWHWHTVDPIGRFITFAEHYEAEQTIDYHAMKYHQMSERLGREPIYNIGDPSIRARDKITMTSVQQEYIKHGIYIILGNNDKIAGINRLRSYLKLGPDKKPMWLIDRRCEKLIWEIKRYRGKKYLHKKVAAEHNLPEEPVDRDNHALDDVRYFVMSRPDIRILGPKESGLDRAGNILRMPTSIPPSGRIARPTWKEEMPDEINWTTEEFLGSEW